MPQEDIPEKDTQSDTSQDASDPEPDDMPQEDIPEGDTQSAESEGLEDKEARAVTHVGFFVKSLLSEDKP